MDTLHMELEKIPKSLLRRRAELPEIVEQTAEKFPASAFVAFGLACCAASSCLAFSGKTRYAIVVGTWAPLALLTGLYLKRK